MKTYQCPYCNFRADKDTLIIHIDDKHTDMIPSDYTSARIVFNIANKKTHGICVVCKKATEWNENTRKYNRLCNNPKCRVELRKLYETNMLRVHNTTTLLDDPEHQQKMLANRSISGKYKFKNGECKTFTGSYEKKALEFFDNVLNADPKDIITPGPVIEYEFEGKKLKWITDILYIPYNLIIEVKDGGSNPNNRNMESYRDKQIAKEKMITSLGTYNYLRLTDNNFAQLLEVMAELKAQMIDDSEDNRKVIIKINESYIINEERVSDSDWKDIVKIYNSLSSKEKMNLGGNFINSPNTKFSYIFRNKQTPVAFVHGYDFGDGELIAEVAVSPLYRGKGLAIKGMNKLESFARKNKFKRVVYLVKCSNTDSINLAKKLGYIFDKKENDHLIYYKTTNYIQESGDPGGMAGCGISDGPNKRPYVVMYGYKNTFTDDVEGFGLSKDIIDSEVLRIDENGNTILENNEFLNDRKFTVLKYVGPKNRYKELLQELSNSPLKKNKKDLYKYIYEKLANTPMLTTDQIMYDNNFEDINLEGVASYIKSEMSTLIENFSQLNGNDTVLPLIDPVDIQKAEIISNENSDICVLEDENGYFAYNKNTNRRTVSHSNIEDIDIEGVKKTCLI